ncbi:hypothetical protein Halru_0707 [Halovivax ruber XH-70]|uniref:Uncharacterized protein n=2 Tax=Halovivax ruber TaxID=387341 RepID=L0I9G2_HALRX|nr:hypothetical protein Halru_0707 [Halovivax ruber XH-70]
MQRRKFVKSVVGGSAGTVGAIGLMRGVAAEQSQSSEGISEFELPSGVETGGSTVRKVKEGRSISPWKFHGTAVAREGGGNTKAVVGEVGQAMDLYTGGQVIRSQTLRAGAGWCYFDISNDVEELELTIDYDLNVEAEGWSLLSNADLTNNVEGEAISENTTFVNGEEYEPKGAPLILPIAALGVGTVSLLAALTNSGGSYSIGYAIDRIDQSTNDPNSRIIDYGDLYDFNDSGTFSHSNTNNYSETITVGNLDSDYTYRLILMGGCAISATGLSKAKVDMKDIVGVWGLDFTNIEIKAV